MTWSVANYNANPALNTAINGTDISELCAAAGFNDALRQIMADIATWVATQAITLPVSVANGGTGQAAAPAALVALGGLPLIFRDLQVLNKNAAFTFADSERAFAINYFGAAAAATINPNATTSITIGGAYVIRNNGTGNLTVTRGAGVSLFKNGSAVSADAVIAVGGIASVIKWDTDVWTANGVGVS